MTCSGKNSRGTEVIRRAGGRVEDGGFVFLKHNLLSIAVVVVGFEGFLTD